MKVILKEEQQESLKLPPFIYKAILNKETSLGDNEALPPFGDFGIEYAITKKGFEEADEIINKYIERGELESKDVDYLLSVLGSKIERCKKLEEPIRPQLQKLCENIVNDNFSIPEDTIILKCRLVGKVKPKNDIRILPEGDGDNDGYDFEDVEEVYLANKVILKRRFINSLIQGLSYWLSTDIDDWYDTVKALNDEIWGLWYQIKHISDYLLYTKKDNVNKKHPNLLSYVEVRLGKNGKKTEIDAQGIIFPYLLRDTFRGLFELFSAHGLPKDSKKALYVINKADFLVAEPWDLRLGKGIVDMLHDSLTGKYGTWLLFKTNMIPFFFKELCSMKVDEFNSVMKNFLLGTRKGRIIASDIDYKIGRNVDYQKFKDRINQKNIDTSVISDGNFSKEELDGYVLQEDMDEMMAYHGSGADFDKFNHKKYLNTGAGSQSFGWGTYVTNDESVALGYTHNSAYKDYDIWDDIYDGLIKNGVSDSDAIYMSYLKDKLEKIIRQSGDNEEIVKSYLNNIITFPEMYNSDEDAIIEAKAMLYAIEQKKRKTAFLYEVEIPDYIGDGDNYLSWYDEISKSEKERMRQCMEKISKRLNFKIPYRFISYTDRIAAVDGSDIYGLLEDILGSKKAASLFLMQCGYDGICYPAGTRWNKPEGASEDAYNYVIFDANKVKIVNKYTV